MKTQTLLAICLALPFLAMAQPPAENEARLKACIADVEAASSEAGDPAKDPRAVCMCMGGKILQSNTLQSEIEAAGGLPSHDTSSDEMKAVVSACKDAKSED